MQAFFGHDIVEMILNAGLMAKFVLIVLLFFSIISWAIIFLKFRIINRINSETKYFLELFWEERNFKKLYSISKEMEYSPVVCMFREVYEEIRRMKRSYDKIIHENLIMEELERTLRRSIIDQTKQLEFGIGFLATTGNTAPFIGLFGTVWGIMEAFRGIGLKGSASLAVVAPGISEALITTAAGLATAIPAVIAFNYFNNKVSNIKAEMEAFMADFLNISERYLIKKLFPTVKKQSKEEKKPDE